MPAAKTPSLLARLGAQPRDFFFLWFWILSWIVTLSLQEWPGRIDLAGKLGSLPSILAVAVGALCTFLLPTRANRPLLLLCTLYGLYTTVSFALEVLAMPEAQQPLAYFYNNNNNNNTENNNNNNNNNSTGNSALPPVMAKLYQDVAEVGPGALGVFLDYAGCACTAFFHILAECLRRPDSIPWPRAQLYLFLSVTVPLVAYPLFALLELPSGQDAARSDTEGASVRLGSQVRIGFAALSVLCWTVWAPTAVAVYRECGPRWQPSDFARCGLGTTAASKFTIAAIVLYVATMTVWLMRRIGYDRGASGSANVVYRLFVQFWWAVLMFINVAAAVAAAVAITFVDIGEEDRMHPLRDAPAATQRKGRAASASPAAARSSRRRSSSTKRA